MMEDERVWAVKSLLFEYVKSPSLRHIREPHALSKLARDIVRALDRGDAIWRKWDGQRELIIKSAVGCWIPIEDLRTFLNGIPGPPLTSTDVAQRMKAFEEENYVSYPKEELQAGCEEIYRREVEAGTELPAIIGLLRDHVETAEERLRTEQHEAYRRRLAEEQDALEQRFLSGADCKWVQFRGSKNWHYRLNGRAYRLVPTSDKKWDLYRVNTITDVEPRSAIGRYRTRGDPLRVSRRQFSLNSEATVILVRAS